MVRVELVEADALPKSVNSCVVHTPGAVVFIVRETMTAKQIQEAIGKVGADLTRETLDATRHRSTTATQ